MRNFLLSLFVSLGAIILLAGFGVGQGPVVVKQPMPKYPAEAKRTGVYGDITVNVLVDEKGKVTSATVADGPGWSCPTVTNAAINASREAARAAALKAVFKPLPQPTGTELRYTFFSPPPPDPTPAKLEYKTDEPARIIGTSPTSPNSGGPGVLNGTALKLDRPEFPRAARAVRAVGPVHVQLLIDVDGSVLSAQPLDGHPLLQSSARTAACGSRFSPTLLEGKPVKVSGVITYNFVP